MITSSMVHFIYGTLKECTDKFFELIDFEKLKFPNFDFAAYVPDDCKNMDEVRDGAVGWFGVKNFSVSFNCDTISLMCAHYGGGGIRSLELTNETDERESFMRMIGESTDAIGYGVLEPNDYTVFEILGEREDEYDE